ncbi:hypothetical protein HO929_02280 [Streptococcus suis]|nr:hypothetical protein [Streptococcus suis]NQS06921.1 hypothetical protein [Streptococcus suis]
MITKKSDCRRSLFPTSVGESFYETPSYISFSYRKRRAWKVSNFYKITKKSDCRRSLFPTSVGDFLTFSKLMFAKLPKI